MIGPANPRTSVASTSVWVRKGAKVNALRKKPQEKPYRITQTLFDGFLKYQTYKFQTVVYGSPEELEGGFVFGPGHHTAAMAGLLFNGENKPLVVLKTGDLRFTRLERGEPYKLDGCVAGRMDKMGASTIDIALAELAEEVGGEVVGSSFRPLGKELTPTMPLESTECDTYFVAAVRVLSKPSGDGGKMEVPELIGAKVVSPSEAWKLFSGGRVSDGARTQVMFGRAFDSIGYVPTHDLFVQDFPELAGRFQTLGLGETWDPRLENLESEVPPAPKDDNNPMSRINSAQAVERRTVPLPSGEMVDAEIRHAIKTGDTLTPVGNTFSSQFLKLEYDRVKVAEYYQDPESGPMVKMKTRIRPVMAFAPGKPRTYRLDVDDLPVPRNENFLEKMENTITLGSPSGASSGQSDLYYHYAATEVKKPEKPTGEGFVTLGEAIRLCRSGHGDAQTEALLLRLAHHLKWNPNLSMSWEDLKRVTALTSGPEE